MIAHYFFIFQCLKTVLGASAWYRTMDEVQRSYSLVTDLEAGTNYEIRVVIFKGRHRYYSNSKTIATTAFGEQK
jgi:hypothetical protein